MSDRLKIPDIWTFETDAVADAFDEHVREQLPWYDMVTAAVAVLARHYVAGGRVYDVGASTGNVGRAIADTLEHRGSDLVAIESSEEMVKRYQGPGKIVHADATTYDFEPFDLCVCFLSLMFVPVQKRLELLQRLRSLTNPGGAVIVVDKMQQRPGIIGSALARMTLAEKLRAGVEPAKAMAKEVSLAGEQNPLPEWFLQDGVDFFRYGEFVGTVFERPEPS